MLGLFSSDKKKEGRDANQDVAKLFFDSFSKKVASVEDRLRTISEEIEGLKVSAERGQVSDLVLLERLQRSEELVKETLVSIKASVEKLSVGQLSSTEIVSGEGRRSAERIEMQPVMTVPAIPTRVFSPMGEVGSLQSITTPTELQVLTLLANEGSKSAPEIGRLVGRSREHAARLMKKLYQEGYIRRDQARIPFRYSLVEKVKQSFKKTEVKDEAKEQISVPQT